jgi:hypothetical protein
MKLISNLLKKSSADLMALANRFGKEVLGIGYYTEHEGFGYSVYDGEGLGRILVGMFWWRTYSIKNQIIGFRKGKDLSDHGLPPETLEAIDDWLLVNAFESSGDVFQAYESEIPNES